MSVTGLTFFNGEPWLPVSDYTGGFVIMDGTLAPFIDDYTGPTPVFNQYSYGWVS